MRYLPSKITVRFSLLLICPMWLTATVLFTAIPCFAQQIETYDTGVYTDIFQSSPSPVFALVSGVGLNGSRSITPLDIQYSLNYLQRGPFDLSRPGASLQISTLFQITAPKQTGLGYDTLQMGFAKDPTVTSFIDPGTSAAISFWLYPNSILLTSGGYVFQDFVDVEVSNGSTSAGFSWGTANAFILKPGEWYKATFTVSNVNSTTLSFSDEIDDYGPTGQQFVSVVDTNTVPTATGNAQFPFTPVTTDSTMYPAIDGMSSGGLSVIDQTTISGPMSPAVSSVILPAVQLSFSTVSGKAYYISSSYDLKQWRTIEGPIVATGPETLFYFLVGSQQQYFRVTQQ